MVRALKESKSTLLRSKRGYGNCVVCKSSTRPALRVELALHPTVPLSLSLSVYVALARLAAPKQANVMDKV